jgi:hypothetical protein
MYTNVHMLSWRNCPSEKGLLGKFAIAFRTLDMLSSRFHVAVGTKSSIHKIKRGGSTSLPVTA